MFRKLKNFCILLIAPSVEGFLNEAETLLGKIDTYNDKLSKTISERIEYAEEVARRHADYMAALEARTAAAIAEQSKARKVATRIANVLDQ